MRFLPKKFQLLFLAALFLFMANFSPVSAEGKFKNCTINPTSAQRGEPIYITIETTQPMKITDGDIAISEVNSTRSSENKHIKINDTETTTTRTIFLGSAYETGAYQVFAQDFDRNGRIGSCDLNPGFTVRGSMSNIKLLAPKSPITTKFKVLKTLSISGLTDGKTYKIQLGGKWKGGHLGDNGNNDWHPSGGTITISNICDNGNAGRVDCEDTFEDGLYNLTITEGGNRLDTLSFEVGAATPVSGSNPCSASGCPTAIGNIPTDPTAFAGKVLGIGIGIAGGIALILMVIGSIRVVVSRGDPKNVAVGREMIVAAILGLLFLIFSVLILRFIGAQVLPTNPFS